MVLCKQIHSNTVNSDRLQNRGPTLAFSATYVAAVVALNFLFHVFQ